MFIKNPEIHDYVTLIKDKHNGNGYFTIGSQLRIFSNHEDGMGKKYYDLIDDLTEEKLFNCVLDIDFKQ